MRKGFTLIELSIVLVVIGLVIGGILAGVDMVRSAELRKVIAETTAYKTAIYTFENKYGGLPGDIINATTFFPTATNGNGNGHIDYLGGVVGEEYYAWQQLALAGLIEGTYTGATMSLPQSKLANGYYRVSYQTGVYTTNGNMISLNSYNTATSLADGPILSPKNVYSLDLKSDDGLAASGKIMGFNQQGVPGCVTNDYTVGSGVYLPTSENITCKVFFVISTD